LLTAHWALETDGGRSMPGHNFAGIKATPGASGKSFATIEGHGATRREVNARFRTYESAEAGARDYVRLLATRYPDAVAAAQVGDSAGFTGALARGGYFTAAPAAYAAGLEQRLKMLEPGAALCPPPSPIGVLARAALDGLLHAFRTPQEDP
jgi:flagellum-specific peptidoglycan hydrolase FlgJ